VKNEEIDQMPAGDDLDYTIAEKILSFRWAVIDCVPLLSPRYPAKLFVRPIYSFISGGRWASKEEIETLPLHIDRVVRYYSTHVDAAWEVVEKLNPKHPLIMTFRPTEKDWWVVLPNEAKHPKGRLQHGTDCMVQAFAETAPLAICRAALKIVEEKSNDV
jgi:hypothetical protein